MRKNAHLHFNQPAPDFDLPDVDGKLVRLSDLWSSKPLLLSFTRHFGCTQCKEMLEELVTGKEKLEKAGLNLVVITQGTVEQTRVFAAQFAPGLLTLCDPARKVYAAYGLERGTLFQTFLNLNVWKALQKSRKKGYPIDPPPAGQDAMQMSGTFIISTRGTIELPFYYDNIADHPSLDLLLSGIFATKWDKPLDGPVGPASE
jgi:peroxiredoxin